MLAQPAPASRMDEPAPAQRAAPAALACGDSHAHNMLRHDLAITKPTPRDMPTQHAAPRRAATLLADGGGGCRRRGRGCCCCGRRSRRRLGSLGRRRRQARRRSQSLAGSQLPLCGGCAGRLLRLRRRPPRLSRSVAWRWLFLITRWARGRLQPLQTAAALGGRTAKAHEVAQVAAQLPAAAERVGTAVRAAPARGHGLAFPFHAC